MYVLKEFLEEMVFQQWMKEKEKGWVNHGVVQERFGIMSEEGVFIISMFMETTIWPQGRLRLPHSK